MITKKWMETARVESQSDFDNDIEELQALRRLANDMHDRVSFILKKLFPEGSYVYESGFPNEIRQIKHGDRRVFFDCSVISIWNFHDYHLFEIDKKACQFFGNSFFVTDLLSSSGFYIQESRPDWDHCDYKILAIQSGKYDRVFCLFWWQGFIWTCDDVWIAPDGSIIPDLPYAIKFDEIKSNPIIEWCEMFTKPNGTYPLSTYVKL